MGRLPSPSPAAHVGGSHRGRSHVPCAAVAALPARPAGRMKGPPARPLKAPPIWEDSWRQCAAPEPPFICLYTLQLPCALAGAMPAAVMSSQTAWDGHAGIRKHPDLVR